ncbi:E3 SUMO-protein ligase ZBED1-like [Triplophysa rosa]|uniref:E3 SUMO-protein ligase ZBED1-like n=1 Tax=Triplophysa rosa TaxID=992332 RepID=UPI0025461773|nr:E3 SUMO-protein ligase ZBED1-like [Triplophysa rosa]
MLPINAVENDGFRKLIKVLDPRYELPGRKHFSVTALPRLYAERSEQLEQELQNVAYFASTSDMWSSRTSEPYLSLTIHFIDKDWKLQSKCLQTAYFPEDHTEKVGKDKRVERAIGVCKNVVSAFSFSWKKKRDLATAQEEFNLPKHKLTTESPTRWGSRQKMVSRVIEQHKAISQVLAADKKTRHLVPTWQDMDVLESVNEALKPLLEFTDSLSGETYVSVSYLKPVLHLFRTEVLKHSDDDTQLTKDIKAMVMDYLDEKYDDDGTDSLLDMASLVDPRFKTHYIKPDKIETIKTRAVSEIMNMEEDQGPSTSQASHQTEEEEAEGEAAAALPAKKQRKTLGSLFKKLCPSNTGLTYMQTVEGELENYLMAPDADSETEPLDWWKMHEKTFPRVSKLAQQYLCIPATSSPSERIFSTGGNIVTCHRAALKPETVDRLVFLARNL